MISVREIDGITPNETKEQKQKLTLGLSRTIIEKAKAAGINISAATEQLLLAITYEPNGNTKDDVVKAYEVLFNGIRPLLIKYDTRIIVGRCISYTDSDLTEVSSYDTICLEEAGLIYYDESSDPKIAWPNSTSVSKVLPYLFKPFKILENLVLELTRAAEINRDKIKELNLALRFVRALSEEDTGGKNDNNERMHRGSLGRLKTSESDNL